MLALLSKSTTAGYALTGGILGYLVSISGKIIDYAINTLSNNTYKDTWATFIAYKIGWWPGAVLGGALGGLAGLITYPFDALARVLSQGYIDLSNYIGKKLAAFAAFDNPNDTDNLYLAELLKSFMDFEWLGFKAIDAHNNFLIKSWKIGKLIVGVPTGLIFSSVGYIVDFVAGVFNAKTKAAQSTYYVGFYLGGYTGGALSTLFSLPIKLYDQINNSLAKNYLSFREKMRNVYAFAYAKLEVTPDTRHWDDNPENNLSLVFHAPSFIASVDSYKDSTYKSIFENFHPSYGTVVDEEENSDDEHPQEPVCGISQQRISKTKNLVVDIHGHFFDEDEINKNRYLMDRPTCPMTNDTKDLLTDDKIFSKSKIRTFWEAQKSGKNLPQGIPALLKKLQENEDSRYVFGLA